jgi:two-component system, cell cycle sensor histidine kinase and response regulator CckA
LDEPSAELGLDPGRYSILAVSDAGRGMSAETLKRAMEPFFTTKEPGKGTGLGLPTVYGIVEAAGGRMHLESEPDRGTTVSLYFPTAVEQAPAPVLVKPRATVLLAEDEPALRRLATSILAERCYQVLEAADGVEALDLAERHRSPIDLLITDVAMPHLGGPELAERLSALRPDVKVLYVPGYADSQLGRNGLMDGSVQILHKPFSPTDFTNKVEEVLTASEGT